VLTQHVERKEGNRDGDLNQNKAVWWPIRSLIMEVVLILSDSFLLLSLPNYLFLLTFSLPNYMLLQAANGSTNLQAKHDLDIWVFISSTRDHMPHTALFQGIIILSHILLTKACNNHETWIHMSSLKNLTSLQVIVFLTNNSIIIRDEFNMDLTFTVFNKNWIL